jgi:predicted esterase
VSSRLQVPLLTLLFVVLVGATLFFSSASSQESKSLTLSSSAAAVPMSKAATRSAAIIFLHGLGDTGQGWSQLPSAFRGRAGASSWRFSLPTAPTRPVTCNGGMKTTAWMDLTSIPVLPTAPDDAAGFTASAAIIHAMIDAEIEKGTAARDIFLGGFSQGGSMSLWAGLSYKQSLGGIISMSGWWPHTMELPFPSRTTGDRVLLCHGTDDSVVAYACKDAAEKVLKARGGITVETMSFDGGHEFDSDEPAWLYKFISARLNATE